MAPTTRSATASLHNNSKRGRLAAASAAAAAEVPPTAAPGASASASAGQEKISTHPIFSIARKRRNLLQAARDGDLEEIAALVHSGEDVNGSSTGKANTPLIEAILAEKLDAMKLLISLGADIELEGRPYYLSPLITSCRVKGKSDEPLRILIAAGAAVNAPNCDGMTALYYAARESRATAVDILLDAGAEVDAISYYDASAPLHCAASAGCTQAIKSLLNAGADVNALKEDNTTPLFGAIKAGSVPAIKILSEAGSDFDVISDRGDPPLRYAISMGNIDIVVALLAAGADPNGKFPITPLMEAATQRNLEITEILLQAGADVNFSSTSECWCENYTGLHAAAQSSAPLVCEALCRAGADVWTKGCSNVDDLPEIPKMAIKWTKDPETKAVLQREMDRRTAAVLSVLPSVMPQNVQHRILKLVRGY